MNRGVIARMSLLALSCAALATAAPLSVGTLYLNDVGSGFSDPLNDWLEFRLTNWNGFAFGNVLTPITFKNVSLNVDWVDPGGPYSATPPGIIGGLDWYLDGDEAHLNPLLPKDLAPNVLSYESSRFQRRWAINQATLTIEFEPGSAWVLPGGGIYSPPSSTYQFVFNPGLLVSSRSSFSLSSLPSFELFLPEEVNTPEPSTYFMGGIGLIALAVRRRRFI